MGEHADADGRLEAFGNQLLEVHRWLRAELADSLGPDADPASVRWVQGEVDGLSAIVESHFRFEEREIISALNALEVPEWTDAPPAFLVTGRPSP